MAKIESDASEDDGKLDSHCIDLSTTDLILEADYIIQAPKKPLAKQAAKKTAPVNPDSDIEMASAGPSRVTKPALKPATTTKAPAKPKAQPKKIAPVDSSDDDVPLTKPKPKAGGKGKKAQDSEDDDDFDDDS